MKTRTVLSVPVHSRLRSALILALCGFSLSLANDKMRTVLMQPCLRFRAIWTDDGKHALFYALRVTFDVASLDHVTCYFCDGWQNMWLLEHNDSSPFCYRASFYAFEPEIKTILSRICFHQKKFARIFSYNAKYHQITNKKSHYINLEH